jgi:hypothetical protein
MSNQLTFMMHRDRETPGTVLFKELSRADGGKPRNLYLPKPDDIAIGKPQTIIITVDIVAAS